VPEIPDLTIYLERLAPRVVGRALEAIRLASPFLLRTVEPPVAGVVGKKVLGLRRVGKRIVLELEDDRFVAIHLMRAGRFRWKERGSKVPAKVGLAAFDFPDGTLLLTEASPKKRASLHLLAGPEAWRALDPGGLEVLGASFEAFRDALARENHTLKRALTDPRLFAGIGNAYSDEILHRACLSPVRQSAQLEETELARLYEACQATLLDWIGRLRAIDPDGFPNENVTAFREGMAVHGRFGEPCPVCGSKVQRIVYAENETNYCPRCQTGGRLLADRSLSRLLKSDWPKTVEELEERSAAAVAAGAPPPRRPAE
jgi:formamidopyrimidine-DNA glycosylase